MNVTRLHVAAVSVAILAFCAPSLVAQKAKPKPKPAVVQPIVFSVLYDGTSVEPIALIEKGKPESVAAGPEVEGNKEFEDQYYRPGRKYDLIFGGAASGTVSIKKSNIGSECGGSSAEASVASARAKVKGLVMALAATQKLSGTFKFSRRSPTPVERQKIESLVRVEYTRNKVSAAALKQIHYHNLTAIDVDGDGKEEFIGSYWVAPGADRRDLIFLIAEQGQDGKIAISYSNYDRVLKDQVMSGDMKDVDSGMGNDLLLDVLDIDGDGTAEIFTIAKAFEGNNYSIFQRNAGKWAKIFETYVYRCAY